MNDQNKKKTETTVQNHCKKAVRNTEETVLLTYFRQIDVMDRKRLLMKAENMAKTQTHQRYFLYINHERNE